MSHQHVGPEDEACDGCLEEGDPKAAAAQRRRTVLGLTVLIALAIGAMAALSWYLTNHGTHIG